MRLTFTVFTVFALVTGCATQHDPGWQGNGAHPYGAAQSNCQEEARAAAQFERDTVYQNCMARNGWSQPPKKGS